MPRRPTGRAAVAPLAAVALCLAAPAARADQAASTDTTATSRVVELARQAQYGTPQTPDTLAARSSIGIRFMPTYLNQISGDVSVVGMKNQFQTSMTTPFGPLVNFLVSTEEKHYRLQNKRDENKMMSASVVHSFDEFTGGSITFSDSRVFNRSIIPGGATQEYIFNDQTVSAGLQFKRSYAVQSAYLKRVGLDASASGGAIQGEKTYKTDQTVSAGGFGGLSAVFLDDRVRVHGRGGHRETWDESETSLARFGNLGSTEDSLSTGLRAELADSVFFDARYVYHESARTWADQAQGSLGGQQGGAQNVFRETETRSTRGVVIKVDAKLLKQFRVSVTGNHDTQLFDYDVQSTRFSNTVGDGLKGKFSYTAPWKTTASVTLENTTTLRDFGPLSVSSYDDIRKRASIALSHQFTKTLSTNLAATTQLTRAEYLDPVANPRDRDQVDTSVNLRINSVPFQKMQATVSLAYSASDVVNIDGSQSGDNRTRELYELRPGFTYTFSDALTVTQLYGIAIEYTDFVYKATQNFLDRNLTFGNKFDFKPSKRITFVFDYALNLHDNGSYLPDPVTGREELTVQGEDRRDRMTLRVDYKVLSRAAQPQGSLKSQLTVFAENRYSRFEDKSVLTDVTTVTTDGQVTAGAKGDYDWGGGRRLQFTLAKVKKFSRFGSDAEKDYWDMRSEFNYAF